MMESPSLQLPGDSCSVYVEEWVAPAAEWGSFSSSTSACAEFDHQVNMYTIHGLYVSQASPMSRDLCIGGDGQLRDNPNTLSLSDSMGG